ncbi:hypothetical protein PoB_004440000 [Plakobranchus ocellatus]|uniref:Uncharacterized protein n=1 Tax=Plakobranchus ocellatus TaxID=259542 RepID=A0AAV4BFL5_9GAST|nr:hypothetical protein PoB_004440000 [Plakobranchus ocellatus]
MARRCRKKIDLVADQDFVDPDLALNSENELMGEIYDEIDLDKDPSYEPPKKKYQVGKGVSKTKSGKGKGKKAPAPRPRSSPIPDSQPGPSRPYVNLSSDNESSDDELEQDLLLENVDLHLDLDESPEMTAAAEGFGVEGNQPEITPAGDGRTVTLKYPGDKSRNKIGCILIQK